MSDEAFRAIIGILDSAIQAGVDTVGLQYKGRGLSVLSVDSADVAAPLPGGILVRHGQ